MKQASPTGNGKTVAPQTIDPDDGAAYSPTLDGPIVLNPKAHARMVELVDNPPAPTPAIVRLSDTQRARLKARRARREAAKRVEGVALGDVAESWDPAVGVGGR